MTSLVASLIAKCRKSPKSIALPEVEDSRVMAAAKLILENGSTKRIHTLCKKDQLITAAEKHSIDLTGFEDKFVSLEEDLEFVDRESENLSQAGQLLQLDRCDAALAGAVSTTAEVIRAAISSVGLAKGGRTISGSFLMNREFDGLSPHTYLYADCGVVINPTLPQLRDIARSSVQTWQKLMPETDPVVAFLSFSTNGSAPHEFSDKIRAAADAFKKECPEVDCEGEIQFDAAFDSIVGQNKYPGSKVPGRANIFIFPTLDAGNIAYKITQRLGHFDAYGPILQGAGKPFSDLSRGATIEDIACSAYINMLRSSES